MSTRASRGSDARGAQQQPVFVGPVRRWRKEWTQVGRIAVLKWVAMPNSGAFSRHAS